MSTAPDGSFYVTIINVSLNDIWMMDVAVDSSLGFPEFGGPPQVLLITSTQASQEERKTFKTIHEILSETTVIDIREIEDEGQRGLITSICPSATGGACSVLSHYLRGLPATQTYLNSSFFVRAWRAIFTNKKLEYFVIYPDGSFEELELVYEFSAAAAFYPEENTSVQADGQPVGGGGSLIGYDDYDGASSSSGLQLLALVGSSSCEYWLFVARDQDGNIINAWVECY